MTNDSESLEKKKADLARQLFDAIPESPNFIYARRIKDDKPVRLSKISKPKLKIKAGFLGEVMTSMGKVAKVWKFNTIPYWHLNTYKIVDPRHFKYEK